MTDDSILVCGSGIVGLACALGLARAGQRVQILGPQPAAGQFASNQYHPRVYAISPSSQQFLADLSVWDTLNHQRISPVRTMEIYGDAGGQLDLTAWQAATDTLAWILESSVLEQALLQATRQAGIVWHTDTFKALHHQQVVTESGRTLAAGLLVGADGAESAVRRAADVAITSVPYGQTALVTHLTASQAHGQTAHQWFGPDGIIALLPLPDTADGPQLSLVWSLPTAEAQALQALPESRRNQQIQGRLLAVTGQHLVVRSPVYGFPLYLAETAMVATGVALVGDAAHRVHPLAGQGLNLGLADAQTLIQILSQRPSLSAPGDPAVLRRYRRRRAAAMQAMGLVTDGLHHLFSSRAVPLIMLRNAGLSLVNRLPGLKRQLIAGASGGLPPLVPPR